MVFLEEDCYGNEEELDDTENFMASELPLLISQAIEWINRRTKQKMKDQIFMKKFAPTRHKMQDVYKKAIEMLLNDKGTEENE